MESDVKLTSSAMIYSLHSDQPDLGREIAQQRLTFQYHRDGNVVNLSAINLCKIVTVIK